MAGTLDILEDNASDSDGRVRWQTLWFVLGPLGNENGEQLVLLRQSTPVQVIVHDIMQWEASGCVGNDCATSARPLKDRDLEPF